MSGEIELRDDKPWLFKKGHVPLNNQGRSRYVKNVRDMARAFTAEGLEILKLCARDEGATWNSRIQAVNTIWDRAWGKPEQSINVERSDDRDIERLSTLELKKMFLESLGKPIDGEVIENEEVICNDE